MSMREKWPRRYVQIIGAVGAGWWDKCVETDKEADGVENGVGGAVAKPEKFRMTTVMNRPAYMAITNKPAYWSIWKHSGCRPT